MLREQEQVLIRPRPVTRRPVVIAPSYPSYSEGIHRDEILSVLNRAATDNQVLARLTDFGSEALQDYDLTSREKAALVSGDIGWIEARIGKLDTYTSTWLRCRLQQERW
jgi:hypothetical protein